MVLLPVLPFPSSCCSIDLCSLFNPPTTLPQPPWARRYWGQASKSSYIQENKIRLRDLFEEAPEDELKDPEDPRSPTPPARGAAAWATMFRHSTVSIQSSLSGEPANAAPRLHPGLQRLQLAGTKLPVARVPGVGIYFNELLTGVPPVLVSAAVAWSEGAAAAADPSGVMCSPANWCQVCSHSLCLLVGRPLDVSCHVVQVRFLGQVPAIHEVVLFLTNRCGIGQDASEGECASRSPLHDPGGGLPVAGISCWGLKANNECQLLKRFRAPPGL